MTKMIRHSQFWVGVSIGVLAPAMAGAQTAPSSTNPPSPVHASSTDDEIVVTASKFGETLLSKTAVSANVITADNLKTREIRNPEDLKFSVPGVYIEQGSSSPRISIRGVGFDNFQLAAENGVAVYVDGVVISRVQAQLAAFNDLERVEVLKGPQGSAFGRNATGGAISYITEQPEPGLSGEIGVTLGSFWRRKISGVVNDGNDRFAVRLSGSHDQDDGYITNLVTGNHHLNSKDQTVLRAAAVFKPTADFTATYSFNYARQHDVGPADAHQNADSANTAIFLGSVLGLTSLAPAGTPAALVGSKSYVVASQFDPLTTSESKLHILTLKWDVGKVILKSISGYIDFSSKFHADVAGPSAYSNGGIVSTNVGAVASKQYSEEFLVSGAVPLFKWVAGAYFLREDASEFDSFNFNLALAAPPPAGLAGTGYTTPFIITEFGAQRIDSYAFYGDTQFNITDRLRINAGARWTHDEKTVVSTGQSGASPNSPGFPAVPFSAPSSGSVKFSRITYQGGVEYDIAPDLFGYAKVGRGYKAGGINANDGSIYRPETLDAFEVGLKGKLLDNRVRFALSGFYNKYRDIQQFISAVGNPVAEVVNAARAKIIGADSEVKVQLSKNFSADAAATWVPTAKYLQFQAIDPLTGANTNLAGARLVRTPRISGTVGLNLDLPINDSLEFAARVEGYRTSAIGFSQFAGVRPDKLTQPGYNIVNVNATLTIDKRIDFRFYARNLTNTFYRTGIFESVGFQYMEFGRPRELGGEVSVRF